MQLQLLPRADRPIIEALLSDYLREIHAITGTGKFEEVAYPYLPTYWEDSKRFPFVFIVEDIVAGFALVNDFVLCKDFNASWSIAEFYVIPGMRGKEIGRKMATLIFEQQPGRWEVRQEINHVSAQEFWKKTIATLSQKNFEQKEIRTVEYHCMAMHFEN